MLNEFNLLINFLINILRKININKFWYFFVFFIFFYSFFWYLFFFKLYLLPISHLTYLLIYTLDFFFATFFLNIFFCSLNIMLFFSIYKLILSFFFFKVSPRVFYFLILPSFFLNKFEFLFILYYQKFLFSTLFPVNWMPFFNFTLYNIFTWLILIFFAIFHFSFLFACLFILIFFFIKYNFYLNLFSKQFLPTVKGRKNRFYLFIIFLFFIGIALYYNFFSNFPIFQFFLFFLFFMIISSIFLIIYYYFFGFFYFYKFLICSCFFCLIYLIFLFFFLKEQHLYINFLFFLNFIFEKLKIFQFNLNQASSFFFLLVLSIFFFSMQFAFFYLYKEKKKIFFFFLVFCFAISMFLIFASNNLLLIYVGWESMGISSFFLIGYYSFKISCFKSAIKAFFFNKISDFIFLIIIFIYYSICGTFSILNIDEFSGVYYYSFYFFSIDLILFFLIGLFLLSFIKSAQLAFSIWLLDSMDAPVPASALIHSATLVISGIFIMSKFLTLYNSYTHFSSLIIFLASITSVFASFLAFFQNDLKKILAYSTISNCSFIILFLFSNNLNFFFYFIAFHGLIKAFVFMFCGLFFFFNLHVQNVYKINFLKAFSEFFYIFVFFLLILSFLPFTFLYDLKHSLSYSNFNLSLWQLCFVKSNLFFSFFFSIAYSLRIILILKHKIDNFYKNAVFDNFDKCNYYFLYFLLRVIFLFSMFLLAVFFFYCFFLMPPINWHLVNKNINYYIFFEFFCFFFFIISYVFFNFINFNFFFPFFFFYAYFELFLFLSI